MLFNLSKPVLIAVLGVVALLGLGLAIPQCHAAEPFDPPYVQISGGETFIRGAAPVLDLTFTEPATVLRNAFWQESLTVIGTSNYGNQEVSNNFALRGLFVDGFGQFDIGLGVAWIDKYLPYNGQHVNFALQLDYRLKTYPITLTYAHMSDAGTQLPNLGRDIWMIGWRFH